MRTLKTIVIKTVKSTSIIAEAVVPGHGLVSDKDWFCISRKNLGEENINRCIVSYRYNDKFTRVQKEALSRLRVKMGKYFYDLVKRCFEDNLAKPLVRVYYAVGSTDLALQTIHHHLKEDKNGRTKI